MTPQSTLDGLAQWHAIVAARNFGALPALMAPAIVFRSPFAHTPYTGPAKVSALLATVADVLAEFTYHREFLAGDSAVLEFSARVGDLALKGIDLIRFDASGQIVEFEVMIRPANALMAVGQEMGKRLASQGITP